MANRSFYQADIQCPFYKRDDGYREVSCEGIVEDSILHQSFERREDLHLQITVFCCEYYSRCELYRMLMANKYADA